MDDLSIYDHVLFAAGICTTLLVLATLGGAALRRPGAFGIFGGFALIAGIISWLLYVQMPWSLPVEATAPVRAMSMIAMALGLFALIAALAIVSRSRGTP